MGIVKQFIAQSKVLEITIGMIVAVAFERVVATMVSGILMPLFKTFRNEMIGGYKTTVEGSGLLAPSNGVMAVEYGGFVEAVIVLLDNYLFRSQRNQDSRVAKEKGGTETGRHCFRIRSPHLGGE